MIVALPIEVKERELYPKLLICYYLLKFDPKIKVLITKSSILMNEKIKKKKLLYFEKSLSEHKVKSHQKFLKNNYIVSLDEEGPFYHWSNILKNNRINVKTINNKNFKFFFLWGENEKKFFKKEILNKNKNKIITGGHPKFDFIKKENKIFYKKELNLIKKKYKKLILIFSSFFCDSVMDERIYKIFLEKTQTEKTNLIQNDLNDTENYLNLINLSIEIAKKFPEYDVVFRPHPRQSIDKIKSRFHEIPKNLHILFKFTSTPWIIASKFYIHSHCTTVHEAYFLKKKIYCIRPNLNISIKKQLTEFGNFFQDNKLLISDLSKNISSSISLKKNKINQKNIKYSLQEEASKSIALRIIKNFKNMNSEIDYKDIKPKKSSLKLFKDFILSNIKKIIYSKFRYLYIFLFNYSIINAKYIFTKDYKINKIKSLESKDILNFFKKINKKKINVQCNKINQDVFEVKIK
jgi:surface carbohydrate biosynthesis protein